MTNYKKLQPDKINYLLINYLNPFILKPDFIKKKKKKIFILKNNILFFLKKKIEFSS